MDGGSVVVVVVVVVAVAAVVVVAAAVVVAVDGVEIAVGGDAWGQPVNLKKTIYKSGALCITLLRKQNKKIVLGQPKEKLVTLFF